MAIELSEKQIKDGWQIVKFGEIAKEVKSTAKDPAEDGLEFYAGLEHLDPQSLRIARKGIIVEDNPSFTRRFSAGQILFGKRRCYQKKATVADFEGICSGDIIVMDAIPKKIISGLLPFIIQSDAFIDWAEKTSSGSLSPRTKWKSLAEFEFPLPPNERQKEILEVLEKAKIVLEYSHKVLISLKQMERSVSNEILFRGVNQSTFKKSFFGKIPKSWQISVLKDLVTEHSAGVYKKKNLYGEGQNIIGVGNLYSDSVVDGQIYNKVPLTGEEVAKFTLHEGDLLYGESSLVRDGIAKNVCVTESGAGTAFAWHTRRYKVSRDLIHPLFLNYFLSSTIARKYMMSVATQTALTGITTKDYFNAKVLVPPMQEQKQIIKTLGYIEEQIKLLQLREAKIQKLLTKLFQDTFGGAQ